MDEPLFRFSYTGTFTDYRALMRAKRSLGPLGRHAWIVRYLAVAVIFAAFVAWFGNFSVPVSAYLHWDVLRWVLLLVLFVPAVDLFFDHVVGRWAFSRFAAANRLIDIAVDEAAIAWSVGAWSGRFEWPGVVDTVLTPDYVFLFLGKIEAITIPQRGIVSGDWPAFEALVLRKVAKPPLRRP